MYEGEKGIARRGSEMDGKRQETVGGALGEGGREEGPSRALIRHIMGALSLAVLCSFMGNKGSLVG